MTADSVTEEGDVPASETEEVEFGDKAEDGTMLGRNYSQVTKDHIIAFNICRGLAKRTAILKKRTAYMHPVKGEKAAKERKRFLSYAGHSKKKQSSRV